MNPTKILWVQILLVCAVVLGFVWAATEWTAWQLAFQPQLGRPWFTLFGWPMYRPPAFFWWWFAYDAYAHEIFVTGGFIAGAGGVAAFVAVFIHIVDNPLYVTEAQRSLMLVAALALGQEVVAIHKEGEISLCRRGQRGQRRDDQRAFHPHPSIPSPPPRR
jgi:type IV secretory pathway TraG/TraD family ATPase VirD4